jgi:hypothetical protein
MAKPGKPITHCWTKPCKGQIANVELVPTKFDVLTCGRYVEHDAEVHEPASILADLQRFNFDTALSSSTAALPSLIAFAGSEGVLYGSDFRMRRHTWVVGRPVH